MPQLQGKHADDQQQDKRQAAHGEADPHVGAECGLPFADTQCVDRGVGGNDEFTGRGANAARIVQHMRQLVRCRLGGHRVDAPRQVGDLADDV